MKKRIKIFHILASSGHGSLYQAAQRTMVFSLILLLHAPAVEEHRQPPVREE
jgi:hypothetical protein